MGDSYLCCRVMIFRTAQPGGGRRDEAGDHGEGKRFGQAGLERGSDEARGERAAGEERLAAGWEVCQRWSEEGADRVIAEEGGKETGHGRQRRCLVRGGTRHTLRHEAAVERGRQRVR